MMTNLFSIFEPSSSIFGLSINWLSTFAGLAFLPYLFWAGPSRWMILWSKIMRALHSEFKHILNQESKSAAILFISLFSLIMFNNVLGLLPYIFTSSSHLAMTLTLGLPLWLSFILYGWLNNTQHMLAHLVPQGTPGLLMPFMVLVETLSNIIRPGTLAVRLAANMIAGHLLLTLLAETGHTLSMALVSLLITAQILLLMLESAVAMIQAYVFAVLSTLYASEAN
uniref:ATP synthase F0 subunit 6 n=1 Tax=Nephropsis grandis TaxID=2801450 RepID=UPI002435D9DE|nr:ATP synthase F0 subunit 6 [Nephropsis grandis]WEU77720.1 ATP synthase F0 subunit 6 [Nephropsis grandis]